MAPVRLRRRDNSTLLRSAMKLGLLGGDQRPVDSCVAGYSRLMGADEIGTLQALKPHRKEFVDPTTTAHNIKGFQNSPSWPLSHRIAQITTILPARARVNPPRRGGVNDNRRSS